MNNLSLQTFIGAVHDMERSQYQILQGLHHIQENFHHNKIYPDLAELIDLYQNLLSITNHAEHFESKFPKRLKDVNLDLKTSIFEDLSGNTDDFQLIRELIEWSLPFIQKTIEEGKTMYEFVDENLTVEIVGILPGYVEEGYMFIPDNAGHSLYLIKYEVSIFTHAEERFRSLKTTILKSIPQSVITKPLPAIKGELIESYPELPNPATYFFSTDLEFPFYESIFPIAKRRLLRSLYS